MRELINKADDRAATRWKLLTGASALALVTYISSSGAAGAANSGRPLIWFEASGQFDQLDDNQTNWIPQFVPGYPVGPLADQYTAIQRNPKTGFDADASIAFQPEDSDWSFRAAIRIGKARQPGSVMVSHHLSSHGKYSTRYDASSHKNESHQIVDFQVGKDVGLGGAEWNAESTVRVGVRIADLRSRSNFHVSTNVPISGGHTAFNDASSRASRRFAGLGPSIAWDASVPIAGTAQDGQLAVDWTAAASLLFGRQRAKVETRATYQGQYQGGQKAQTQYTYARHKNVTVPNLGASLGVSYRWSTARVSLGYRADFFFNAIDGGIATASKENRGFFGPYAAISIGIGD